jgi:hypothetical protein
MKGIHYRKIDGIARERCSSRLQSGSHSGAQTGFSQKVKSNNVDTPGHVFGTWFQAI